MSVTGAWTRVDKLTIDRTKYSGTVNNYPALFTEANLNPAIFTYAKAGGADIRFTSDVGGVNELAFEINIWDLGATKCVIFCNVGTITTAVDPVVYIWYGNAAASAYTEGSTYGKHNVWDSNFKSVWHLTENGTGQAVDSTVNSWDSTSRNAVSTQTNPLFYRSASFVAASSHIIKFSSSLSFAGSGCTIEIWNSVNALLPGTGGYLVVKESQFYSGIGNYGGVYEEYLNIHATTSRSASAVVPSAPVAWNYCFTSFPGHPGTVANWNNLTAGTTFASDGPIQANNFIVSIGKADNAWPAPFDGRIQEVRLSNIARSTAYREATYNNISDPATFSSWGDAFPAPTLISPLNNATGVDLPVTFQWDKGDVLVPPGINWEIQASAADNDWDGLAYGNGLFVAVSNNGYPNQVMTSTDGINWTSRASASNRQWNAVTYGAGLFVAVAFADGGGTATGQVMISTDGINWTSRNSASFRYWYDVIYAGGKFVAVASLGTATGKVMTSTNGTTWTSANAASDNQWVSLAYGNGTFVAVALTGAGNRVMTSPDGTTWTSRNSAANNRWRGVTFGNGLFVAVSEDGSGNRVMTSPDGITWTSQTSAADSTWQSVVYGNGLFVAVAYTVYPNQVMTSPDGINWDLRTSAVNNAWNWVVYGNGIFVTTALTGTGNRVMTSSYSQPTSQIQVSTTNDFSTTVYDESGLTSDTVQVNILDYDNLYYWRVRTDISVAISEWSEIWSFNTIIPGHLESYFKADVVIGDAQLTVNFTDLSLGTPIDWYWDFGDGTTSVLQNPTHTYDNPGIYTVSLEINSADDQNSKRIRNNYITVKQSGRPQWVQGYPVVGAIYDREFDVFLKMDKDVRCYFVILPVGSETPTPEQIIAGTDAFGVKVNVKEKGSVLLTAYKEKRITVPYLIQETTYNIYLSGKLN